MKFYKKFLAALFSGLFLVGVSACDKSAEDVGEAIDDAASDTGDAISDAASDAADATEDAMDSVKEKMDE